mmetsp:Transcript_21382/g.72420  ORF Transcript_21382/g.72420 Transcript_21382/m.72420 type:complete len:228 (-) Transcript_21382:269-952(-)
MGVHVTTPSLSFFTMPGRTSISSPTLSTPWRMEPPATPPLSFSTSSPGLFTSKERMTISRGSEVKSRRGTGTALARYSQTQSTLYFKTAEMGMIGAASATVPATNLRICSCCASAASGLTKSTLFWRMMMCSNRIISTAARCSDVCGCGHGSLPATRSSAASITAAPLSIVAIRMSWPGQSTKETWRTSDHARPCSSVKWSGLADPWERKLPGPGSGLSSLKILAFA